MRSRRATASTPTAMPAFFSADKLESHCRKIHAPELTLQQSAAANLPALRGHGRSRWKENSDDSRIRGDRSDGAIVSLAHLHLDVGEAASACSKVDRDQGSCR